MDRAEVYNVIDGERSYQEKVWGDKGERRTTPACRQISQHDPGQWMVFMEYYMGLAKAELTTKHGEEACLHMLRKVVALGVACFEQHGCPKRI